MDWFAKLTGFKESSYDDTKQRLVVDGNRLRSTVNGQSYGFGILETPTLAQLRSGAALAAPRVSGKLSVTNVRGDVRALHRDPDNVNALFQVASQFNLLEMTGPQVTPEDGVTRYEDDPTQGPACAIAAGAATVYRNYFAPVDGHVGQRRDRQIDCLRDIGAFLGNDGSALWKMVNGYALCSASGLAAIDRKLRALGADAVDELRDRLRIGLHWQVEVTDMEPPRHLVSQAFCSALPVGYMAVAHALARNFATLVLEGAYEATLAAAALNAAEHGCRIVYLTRVGGGVFENDHTWIDGAMRRALRRFAGVGLDVRIVSRSAADPELVRLAEEFR
jgi:hypothetical protein